MLLKFRTFISRLAFVAIQRKWRREIVLIIMCCLFLQLFLCHYYMINFFVHVLKRSDDIPDKVAIHRASIEFMINQSKKNNIELFLIQPSTVESNSSLLKTLEKLDVVTFGINGNNSAIKKDWVSREFNNYHLDIFTAFCNSTVQVPARVIFNMTELPCHYFIHVKNSDVTYHVIVFYTRGDNFTWSDEVIIKNDTQPFWLKLDRLEFGKFPVSFKNLESETRSIGNMTVPVGKYVKNFNNNRFIECDYTRADLYLKQNNISSKMRNSYLTHRFLNLLSNASKALDKIGVDFWLSSGTLLGWYRECGVILHTSDVDIELNITQYSSKILETFKKHGFYHRFTFGTLESGYEYSLFWNRVKIDVFFSYEDNVSAWVGGTMSNGRQIRYIVPKFTLCWTELIGLRVRVPCQTNRYIEATYGKNWNTPKKNWLWFRDASNIQSMPKASTSTVGFTQKYQAVNSQLHKLIGKTQILNTTPTQKNAIELFIRRIKRRNIGVFLIQSPKGESHGNVITFGVNGTNEVVKHGLISRNFRKGDINLFTLFCNSTVKIPARKLYKILPCHIFVRHENSNTTYHVVVFYERGDNFIWSDKVNIKNRLHPPWLKINQLEFGGFPASFKSLESETRRIGNMTVPVGKYVKNFNNNRFIECDYTRADLYLKQNNISSEVRNSYLTHRFLNLLSNASKALDKIGVEFWLSSGTLLGWYRECGFIPHTTDVDIEIKISQFSKHILTTLKQHGFFHGFTFGKLEAGYQYGFYWNRIKLDVFFSYEDKNTSWIGGALPDKTKIKFVVPKFTLCWAELLGLRVRIPCQTDKYIEATYGKNWNKPTRQWLWYRDALNVQKMGSLECTVYKWFLLVILSLVLINVVTYHYIKSYHYVVYPDSLLKHNAKIVMFLKKTKRMGISVFFIEPEVPSLTSEILTFGLDGGKLKDKINFNERDEEGEFDFTVISCNDTVTIPVRTKNNITDIPCHIFMKHNSKVTFHVIIFYTRGENFMWSDEVNIKNGSKPSWLKLDRLEFGKFPVSFKSVETETRRIGNMTVPVGKYVKNFNNNRFIECDYTRADLYLKQNNISRSSALSLKAMKLLESAAKLLDEIGVEFWLSSGTLLGWYRECGIIKHTTDLDIEINITDYTDSIKEGFKKQHFSLANTFGKAGGRVFVMRFLTRKIELKILEERETDVDQLNDSYEYQMVRNGLRIDVFFVYEDKDNYWVGGTDGKTKLRFLLPKFTLCWTELLGLRVRVPCETDSYILKSYGENWNKPKKSWKWASDASNMIKAGRWD